jgi:hypothetical protein
MKKESKLKIFFSILGSILVSFYLEIKSWFEFNGKEKTLNLLKLRVSAVSRLSLKDKIISHIRRLKS